MFAKKKDVKIACCHHPGKTETFSFSFDVVSDHCLMQPGTLFWHNEL